MVGGSSRDGWHPRHGAVPVVWQLHDEHGVAYAAMQRLEDDAGGPHAFEVRAADGRELGVHPTGDAAVETAYADWITLPKDTADEADEERDKPY